VNSRSFFSVVVFLIVNSVFSVKADYPCSLLFFGVQNNRILITRYKVVDAIANRLELDNGHLLFDVDLNQTDRAIETLMFNPNNYRDLLFMAQVDKWVVPFIFSWSSLITQSKQSFNNCDIVHFTISSSRKLNDQQVKGCFLTGLFGDGDKKQVVEVASEERYTSACGVFLPNEFFSYDSGMFTRTLTRRQVDALGLIHRYKKSEITYLLCAGFCRFVEAHYKNLRYWGVKGSKKTKKMYEKIRWFCAAQYAYLKRVLSFEKQAKNIGQRNENGVQESLVNEQDLDLLLEEVMNEDLSFIPDELKADPALLVFGKKIGVAIFLKYLAFEKKMKEFVGWGGSKISGNK